ncbi:MAG: PadR family transcriptional regulator [Solirubrobacteraceae bacterium]
MRDQSTAGMRSPINWALLGLVIQRPSYGYELVQRFERTYADTLELSSRSQIYTALDSLSRRGLIEHAHDERGEDPVRQPKLHYRATEPGVRSYEQWLIEQMSEDRRRSRLIAQQFATLSPEHALRVLERCAEVFLDVIGGLGEDEDEPQRAERPEALAGRLVEEEERLRAGAMLGWIEYARSELRAAASRARR